MKEGSKYQPLLEFLHGSNQREVILTFAEVHEEERCLFFPIGAVPVG